MDQRYIKKRAVQIGLILIVGIFLIVQVLVRIQKAASWEYQRRESEVLLNDTVAALDRNNVYLEELSNIYYEETQEILGNIKILLESEIYGDLRRSTLEERSAIFAEICEKANAEYVFVLNRDGQVILSADKKYFMRNAVSAQLLSEEALEALWQGTSTEEGVQPVTETIYDTTYYLYSTPMDLADYLIILGEDTAILDLQFASLKDIGTAISSVVGQDESFVFAVDKQTHDFMYFDNGTVQLTGENAIVKGLGREVLTEGYSGLQTIDGVNYFCVSREYDGYMVVCAAMETNAMYSGNGYALFWSINGFLLLVFLCTAYTVILRNHQLLAGQDKELKKLFTYRGKQVYLNKGVSAKVIPLTLFGLVCLFLLSYYAQTLLEISNATNTADSLLNKLEERINERDSHSDAVVSYYEEAYVTRARLIATILEEDPELLNEETTHYHALMDENGERTYLQDDEGNALRSVAFSEALREICDRNKLEDIYIYDQTGRIIATSSGDWDFRLSTNEEEQSYEFRSVLDGKTEYLIQARGDDERGEDNQYIGVTFTYYTTLDENGETLYVSRHQYEASRNDGYEGNPIHRHESLLQIAIQTELMDYIIETIDVSYLLSGITIGSNGYVMGFDNNDDYKVIYSPLNTEKGKTAETIGIPEIAFNSSFNGFRRIEGLSYYQCFRNIGNYTLATVMSERDVHRMRLPVCATTTGFSILFVLLILKMFLLTTDQEEEAYALALSQAREENHWIAKNLLAERSSGFQGDVTSRWSSEGIKWKDCTPEQKLSRLGRIALGFIIIVSVILVLIHSNFLQSSVVIRYIISGNWERSLNAFAVSAGLLLMIMIVLGIDLVSMVIRILLPLTGTKSETIGNLLLSIAKYFGVLAGIFYCLYLIGLNASSLIASAGIMTAIIGLGAQSLIGDILAGIFIVFEGEFRVGDIIMVDGYKGTVMDIGMRTTKVLSLDRNIRVYNNSSISGVINMTKETSYASVKLTVGYDTPTMELEAILREELPKLNDKIPRMLSTPNYIGIDELGPTGKTIIVSVICKERDTGFVRRNLNREILRILEEHHVKIYPILTQPIFVETGEHYDRKDD